MADVFFMQRCFDLAQLGAGSVSPNPMVGAVLVHEDRIIGEGWHKKYGEAHAEVNCIRSVAPENQQYIPYSTLYCSLEPCFHFGKTPPCVDLIIQQEIPRVVVCNTDPNPRVAGQSIEKMKAAGIEVKTGVLEKEGRWLNRAFFCWIRENRPYIILKWAQTADGFIGKTGERTFISDLPAQRMVHQWRSEADAILVGTNTAVTDNPRLDTRFYFGKTPLRISFDLNKKIPAGHHLLDDSTDTWIFGPGRAGNFSRTQFIPVEGSVTAPFLLEKLVGANRAVLFVEGGANILNQFLSGGWWDEIRILESSGRLGSGIAAPGLPLNIYLVDEFFVGDDKVSIFRPVTIS